MENAQTDELLRLTSLHRTFSIDSMIPTEVKKEGLLDVVRAAAPTLLIIFGDPTAAVEGVNEMFGQLFSRLDRVEETLDRIEKSINRLEQKQDAATLAKFRAGFNELHDGVRANKRSYGEQLILSSRNKLTELAELPSGLEYSEVSSQMIAAASCLLIAIIDTWSGEIGCAQKYNLRAIVIDPLWSENYVPKSLIRSIAGIILDNLELEKNQKVRIESERIHDFFWKKVGVGAGSAVVGAVAAVGWGIIATSIGQGSGYIAIGLKGISHYFKETIENVDNPDAQKKARKDAICKIKKNTMLKRAEILHAKAKERLIALGD